MRLTIFGATGGTGRQLVEQALAAGHQVVAFVRNPAKLATRHERLTVVQGKLTDLAAIEQAMSSADAVISVLGPRGGSNDNPGSGKVRVGYLGRGEVGLWISRADLAGFMLKQVQDMTYLRQAPVISN